MYNNYELDNGAAQDLFNALYDGNNDRVKMLCNFMITDLNVRDQRSDNGTPLIIASMLGNSEIVKFLIEKLKEQNKLKESINLEDIYGNTALDFANHNKEKNQSIIEVLIKVGAKPGIKQSDVIVKSHTINLDLSADKNLDESALEKFIQVMDDIQKGQLHVHAIISQCDLSIVKLVVKTLLSEKENRFFIDLADNDGWTPLHYVCNNFEYEKAQYLIEEGGVDVNKATAFNLIDNSYNNTPLNFVLYRAALDEIIENDSESHKNFIETVKVLLKASAKNIPNSYKEGVIHYCKYIASNELISLVNKHFNLSIKEKIIPKGKAKKDKFFIDNKSYDDLLHIQQELLKKGNFGELSDFQILCMPIKVDDQDKKIKLRLHLVTKKLVELTLEKLLAEQDTLPINQFSFCQQSFDDKRILWFKQGEIKYNFAQIATKGDGWCALNACKDYLVGQSPEAAIKELIKFCGDTKAPVEIAKKVKECLFRSLYSNLENSFKNINNSALPGEPLPIEGKDADKNDIKLQLVKLYKDCSNIDDNVRQERKLELQAKLFSYLKRNEVQIAYLKYILIKKYPDCNIAEACLAISGKTLVVFRDDGNPSGKIYCESASSIEFDNARSVIIARRTSLFAMELQHYFALKYQGNEKIVKNDSDVDMNDKNSNSKKSGDEITKLSDGFIKFFNSPKFDVDSLKDLKKDEDPNKESRKRPRDANAESELKVNEKDAKKRKLN